MIFPQTAAAAETVASEVSNEALGSSFKFDYHSMTFQTVDGSPVDISGIDAVKQWLELFCKTVSDKYGVYSGTGFGVDTDALIGRKLLPSGAIVSEIKREVEEGALLCPAIRSVYGFDMSGSAISFVVTTIFDETEAISIEL